MTNLRCATIARRSRPWQFVPATLVNTASPATSGSRSSAGRWPRPLIVGPTGGNGVLQPNGDLSLARAAAAAGVPFCLSTMAAVRLERVPEEAGGRLWMQLYVTHNRQSAEDIVARADAAGYEGAGIHHGCECLRVARVGPAQLLPARHADLAQPA